MRTRIVLLTREESPLASSGTRDPESSRSSWQAGGSSCERVSTPSGSKMAFCTSFRGAQLAIERVIALPRLVGVAVEGIPHDGSGFVHTDAFGLDPTLEDVYAAGDGTGFPIKQGGVAPSKPTPQPRRSHRRPALRSSSRPSIPFARAPSDRLTTGIPSGRVGGRPHVLLGCRRHAALVAPGENLGPLPGAVPRRARRPCIRRLWTPFHARFLALGLAEETLRECVAD